MVQTKLYKSFLFETTGDVLLIYQYIDYRLVYLSTERKQTMRKKYLDLNHYLLSFKSSAFDNIAIMIFASNGLQS